MDRDALTTDDLAAPWEAAMRVVRPGTLPDRTIRATCSRCKAVIEFLPEEGRDASEDGDQRSVGLVAVRCPECGAEVVGRERR